MPPAAKGTVAAPPAWTPKSTLANAVYTAGFLYDPGQDILYSRMDALQRQFGYAYGYDAAALGMNMILDCEPIFFDYAGKHWMIELWKGQYILEAGGEIGVYNRPIGSVYPLLDPTVGRRPRDPIPAHNLFYDCANDNELLEMSFTLYKNGQKLFSRGPEKHWWLTGFKWGVYARPDELKMDASITCRDAGMCTALVGALRGMGYDVNVSATTVRFTFATPKTHQPRSETPSVVQAAETTTKGIVDKYKTFGLQNNDPNTIPPHAAEAIISTVGIYSVDFFVQVVANLAKNIGLDAYKVINDIAQTFKVGLDVVTDAVTQAGYDFSSWVGSVERALGINLNFSCIVDISNRGNPYDLILENQEIRTGIYKISPPNRISAGRVGRFLLEDPKPTPVGAEGWVRYYYVDATNNRHSVRFKYACPFGWDPNIAETNAPFNFYTKSESASSGWGGINQIKKEGHPLFVAFVYGNERPPR
jgi:hypothetical protein